MQKSPACIRTHLTLTDERAISGIISSNGETDGVQFAAHDLVLFVFSSNKCSAVPWWPCRPWTGGQRRARRARTRQNRAGATSPASPGSCPMSPLRDECAHRLMSPLNHVEHPGKNYDSLLGALGPPLRVPRSSSRPSHLFCPLFILCRSSVVPPHAAQEPGIRTCSPSPIPPFECAGDISGEQSRERKQQAGYPP